MSDATTAPVTVMSARTATGTVDPLTGLGQEIDQRFAAGREARMALTERVTALEGKALRATVVSGAAGTIALTGFGVIVAVVPISAWSGQREIVGTASAVTRTGFTAAVMQSRATLLLSSGPFEAAPAGTVATFLVIGTAP